LSLTVERIKQECSFLATFWGSLIIAVMQRDLLQGAPLLSPKRLARDRHKHSSLFFCGVSDEE